LRIVQKAKLLLKTKLEE